MGTVWTVTAADVVLPLSKASLKDARAKIVTENGVESVVWEGPADESFEIRFDWPQGVSPADFDLVEFDGAVEGGRGGFIASVTHPAYQKGFKALYYAVDRPPTALAPVHLDLHMPECFEDLKKTNPPGLTLSGVPRRTGVSSEKATRVIRIANVRLVKQEFQVDWDQIHFTMTRGKDGSVSCRYPVEVKSLSDKPVTVTARLQPLAVRRATCSADPGEFTLEPGA